MEDFYFVTVQAMARSVEQREQRIILTLAIVASDMNQVFDELEGLNRSCQPSITRNVRL